MEHVILTGNDVLHQAVSCFVDVDVFLKKEGEKCRNKWTERWKYEIVRNEREKEEYVDQCQLFSVLL